MITQTIITALAIVVFAAPSFADHNKTSYLLGLEFLGQGKKEGHWTEVTEDGHVFEGYYVDGERRGPWSARFAAKSDKCPYTHRAPDLTCGFMSFLSWGMFKVVLVGECLYVKGEECEWTVRNSVRDNWMSDNKDWMPRNWGPMVAKGPMVDNKPHGHWIQRRPDGHVQEGQYANGERHGEWTVRNPNEPVEIWTFHNGKFIKQEKQK